MTASGLGKRMRLLGSTACQAPAGAFIAGRGEMMRSLALFALLLVAACGPRRPLPDLPAVDLTGAQAGVRDVIDRALAAARAKPQDASLAAQLGMALHAHNQVGGAALAYERAAGLDPSNAVYAYYWGTALAADGRYADAVPPLRASLKLRDDAPVRLRLADSLYAAGQAAHARREYEALIAVDSSLAAAHYGLGRCLQGAEAIAALQRAAQLFPRFGAARFAMAGIYRQLGQRALADAALENYERDKLLVPPMNDPAIAAVQALPGLPRSR